MLRDEFQWKRFGFGGIRSERLCVSQWRIPVCVYLSYRWGMMIYTVMAIAYHSTQLVRATPAPLSVYLTIWSYATLTLYFILHFFAASFFHCLGPFSGDRGTRNRSHISCCSRPSVIDHARSVVEDGRSQNASSDGGTFQIFEDPDDACLTREASLNSRPSWYLIVIWVLFDIVSVLCLTVSMAFFVFLFSAAPSKHRLSVASLQVHLINSVLVLIENLVTAVPHRLLHVIYPLLFVSVYALFSLFYWTGDHSRVIYPEILNWNDPGPTVGYILVIGVVVLPAFHVLLFLLYKAKRWVYERC